MNLYLKNFILRETWKTDQWPQLIQVSTMVLNHHTKSKSKDQAIVETFYVQEPNSLFDPANFAPRTFARYSLFQKIRRPLKFSYSEEKSIYQWSRFCEITQFWVLVTCQGFCLAPLFFIKVSYHSVKSYKNLEIKGIITKR